MFLLLFTGVGLGEIYVTKKTLYNPFCVTDSCSLYLVQLSHLLFLENSVAAVSRDKPSGFI